MEISGELLLSNHKIHFLKNSLQYDCREHSIQLGEMNKIFCSQWLNGHQIVFGSKCNKVT